MDYKTGYFAKLNKYVEAGYLPISIARINPKGIKIMQWTGVAPSQELLSDYKSGKIDASEYKYRYTLQLKNRDIQKDWNFLIDVISRTNENYKGVVFLCYEKPDSFCHRFLFADYMKENFNINIKELVL